MKLLVVLSLIVLLLIFIALWVGFTKVLLLTSRYELKKRAQQNNQQAKVIYALTADGREVYIAMLLGTLVSVALITLFAETLFPSVIAVVFTSVVVLLFGIYLPFLFGEKLGLNVSEKIAPFGMKILRAMRPITRPMADRVELILGKKSMLYSKEQLLHIIEDQTTSPLGDISADEARLIKHSLEFSGKTIREYMIPRRVVTMVQESDSIGPVLLDELHKSGHSRFPVYATGSQDTIVGTLYLHDLVGAKKSGSVASAMSKKVYFVHEELDLGHALDAFIKTKHHLFIVVNNFEEFMGILTIEDVIEQLLGRQIMDEFDAYENLREVAALHAKRAKQDNNKKHV
jgi:CBS domain containing-hemolysin-like protein